MRLACFGCGSICFQTCRFTPLQRAVILAYFAAGAGSVESLALQAGCVPSALRANLALARKEGLLC